MKFSNTIVGIAMFCLILLTGCSTTSTNPTTSNDPYIRIDDKQNAPVTQKTDPYNSGQVSSSFFGSTTVDLTQKVGSTAAIIQTILQYSVPNKTTIELQLIAKTMFDGIAEGASINAKILGETSRLTGTASGFSLNGSASATTGAWDYSYTDLGDIDIKLTKVNGKIQLSVSTPINLMFNKRGGAGNPAYPSFNATSMFSLQFSY
ncbi:MAG: hypothetical protein IPM69_08880 [Ignavibacteria bacterium]|nr:hypothetical protein [Ignavibacteria bacterium]